MSEGLPGKGLFGWLGRQVGHVKKAVKTPPAKLPPAGKSEAPADNPKAPAPPPQVLYRENKIEEAEHPSQPGVKLRRTIIDEVIVDEATPARENLGDPDQ